MFTEYNALMALVVSILFTVLAFGCLFVIMFFTAREHPIRDMKYWWFIKFKRIGCTHSWVFLRDTHWGTDYGAPQNYDKLFGGAQA